MLLFEYVLQGGRELIFAHCDVYKWNKEIKKELIYNFYLIFKAQSLPILVATDAEDVKLKKFAVMNGFIPYMDDVPIQDGKLKDMFIWKDL